jgi:hypothetical protein
MREANKNHRGVCPGNNHVDRGLISVRLFFKKNEEKAQVQADVASIALSPVPCDDRSRNAPCSNA